MQEKYKLLQSMNVPVQTSVIGSKDNTEYHNTHNALYISTGELHGGYIGLKFDCVKNKSSYIVFCLETINVLPHTLTSTTPELGYHYIFKLNKPQQKCLADYTYGTLDLFGHSVDVIYNNGRMILEGQYEKNCPLSYPSCYTIVDPTKPAIMPDIIFNEIMDLIRGKRYCSGCKKKLKEGYIYDNLYHKKCYKLFLRNRICTICKDHLPNDYKIDQTAHNLCINPVGIRYCKICLKKLPPGYELEQISHELCIKPPKRYCLLCRRSMPPNPQSWMRYHKACYFKKKRIAQNISKEASKTKIS